MDNRINMIVKLYSEEPLENVMSMISYKPQNMIFVGHKDNMITKKINSIKAFNKKVAPETKLEFLEVSRNDLNAIIATLSDIVRENPDCKFDLTGGSELILIALGCITARINIRKIRIDPYTGTEIEIVGGDINTIEHDITMDIADNIVLHGGVMTKNTGSYSHWRFTDEFREDIRTMWDICKVYKDGWNKACAAIDENRKNTIPMEDGFVSLPKNGIGVGLEILRRLEEVKLINDYSETNKRVIFRYKNNMIRSVIGKIGNLLELHIYEVATRNKDVFTDAIIGAYIDWDGDNYNADNHGIDTINEIDVILMKDIVPIFISCKSGKAGGQCLHELATVTRRFGGKYARKALVLARASDDTTGTKFFKQRAKDMHIWIIDNVFKLSDEQLLSKLKRL